VLALWAGGAVAGSTADTNTVSVSGWHLYVNGQRFIIKGVCYNPVPIGSTTRSWETLDDDILQMQVAGINTIRTYSPIEEPWVLDRFAAAGIKVIMGFTAFTGAHSIHGGGYLTYIDAFKDHDAILLWELGNEYNYHPDWFGGDVDNWYSMLEGAARQIHLIDPDHPVSTAHGEVPSTTTLAKVPSVDLWGMNVYRWDYSHQALIDFSMVSDKPCYLAETGGDSFNSVSSHPTYQYGENEQMQADATQALLNGVYETLDVGSGVTLFEFSDEWWKAGDPWTQNTGGSAPYSSGVPYDGAANEEFWGIVEIDRTPKLARGVLSSVYNGPACLVSAHAGSDQYLPIGANRTTLDGSTSSHTGPLSFDWEQASGPTTATFSDPSSMHTTVGNLTVGTYTFSLTVTGDCGTSDDTVRVSVSQSANTAPIAQAGPDQILAPGTTSTTLNGSASSDPDGGPAPLTYAWRQTAGSVLAISGTWEVAPIVAGIDDGDSYTFELVVFDGLAASFPSRITISVDPLFVDGFESGDLSGWSFWSSGGDSGKRRDS
jgi:hypothetical protein